MASFSSWKMRSVKLGGFVTKIGPWIFAIVPGPPVEPMLTVTSASPVILTGSLLARTLTVLPSSAPVLTLSVPTRARVVDVDRIDAALAVDICDDEVGCAVDADVIVAVGPERVLGVQGQRADVVV